MRSLPLALLVLLLVAGRAPAMELQQFDRMAVEDQSDYIVVMIQGAQKVLIAAGHKDLADKVHKLFTTTIPGDDGPIGSVELESNIARARLADVRNLEKDPKAVRLHVEDAMAVTLKKNGIDVPRTFYSVGDGFKPTHSPPRR